jgi:hypothetical protein
MRRYPFQCIASLAVSLSLFAAGSSFAQQPAPTPTGATTTPAPTPTAATPAPPPDPNASPEERAMALFRKGIEAHKQGNLVDAEGFYRTAFDLKKSYDIAGNLGDVELKLGKPRDAAEHLSFTIRNFPLTGKPELRERMQKALAEAKHQVGAVKIGVNVERAEVFVDGKAIGKAPITEEYFVDPGAHSIEGRMKGYKPAKQAINATKGTLQEIKLTLIAIAPPPPPKRSKAPAVALGIGAAVGFGAGLGLFLASNSKYDDAVGLTNQIKDARGSCRDEAGVTPHPLCGDLTSTKSTVNTLDGLAIGAAGLGGLALVGMVVYLALPNPAAPAPRTTGLPMRIIPTAGRDSGGLLVSGSF